MDRAYLAAACLVLAIAAALPELAQTNLGKRITIDVTDAVPQIANLSLLPHEPSRVVAHMRPVAPHKGHFVVRASLIRASLISLTCPCATLAEMHSARTESEDNRHTFCPISTGT